METSAGDKAECQRCHGSFGAGGTGSATGKHNDPWSLSAEESLNHSPLQQGCHQGASSSEQPALTCMSTGRALFCASCNWPCCPSQLTHTPLMQNETDDIYQLTNGLGILMPSTESSAVSHVVSSMARAQLEIQAVIARDGLAAVLTNSSARTHGRLKAGFQIHNFNDTAGTEGLTSWSRRLLATPCSSANSILVSRQLLSLESLDAHGSECQVLHEMPHHMSLWAMSVGLGHLCFQACGVSLSWSACVFKSVQACMLAASVQEQYPTHDISAACRPASLGPSQASPAWRCQLCSPRPSLPPH